MSKIKLTMLVLGSLLINNATLQAADEENNSQVADQNLFDSNGSNEDTKTVDAPATQADLQGVRTEITILREQWQRKLDKGTVLSTRNANLSGSFTVNYGFYNGNVTSAGVNDGFKVGLSSVGFKGNLHRDYEKGKNIDYALTIGSDKTSFTLLPSDIWLSYQILPSLDPEKPYLKVTAGQQKKPFGLEATTSDDKKPTVTGAQFASTMKLNERDLGLLITGDLFPVNDYGFKYRVPLIEYNFMVLNGNGPVGTGNLANADNSQDLLGRIVINAPVEYSHVLRGLSVGSSYYRGKKTTNITNNAVTVASQGDRNRFGADIAYVNTPVGFTYEYAQAKDPVAKTVNGVSVLGSTNSDAHTFTLFYNFGEQFVKGYVQQDRYDDWWPTSYQPFFRFDRLTPDTSKRSTRTDVYTVGFNWFFAETTKLQINYNRTFAYLNGIKSLPDNALVAQFQFGF
ncbi:MAG: porin [Chlorobium sp.]